MSSDEPFTSVNWDRGETEATKNEGNPVDTVEDNSGQNLPFLEENHANSGSSLHMEGSVLDSSSIHSHNQFNKEQSPKYVSKPWADDNETANHEDKKSESGSNWTKNDNYEHHQGRVLLGVGNGQSEGVTDNSNGDFISSSTPETDPKVNERKSGLVKSKEQDFGQTEPEAQASQHMEETESEHPSFDPSLLTKDVPTQDINGQQQMEEAFQKYTIDSRVTNPISDRDGSSKPFISYLITTETDHPELLRLSAANAASTSPPAVDLSGKSTVKIRRRYGDFRFLHDCLVSDFPQLLVPPLPAKSNFKYLTGDTFSTSFVHKRLHSLDRFVRFICQHKLLSQSSVFHYFISDSSEWASFTKNLKILKGEDGEGSIVGKVVNEDLLTETIMNFFTPSKHKKETNKDILEISDKLKKLYENLVKLDRIFSKLNKKNVDLKHDYESFSSQINKLASLHDSAGHTENGSHDANASFASSVDATQASATGNFKIFSDSLIFFSENWAGLGRYIDESFLVSLKDCAKYIARLSGLIELHHNKKIDLQVLEDYLVKARSDLAGIGGSVGGEYGHRPPPNAALIGQNSGGLVNNTTQLIKDTLSTSATPHIGSSQTEGKKQKLQQKIHHLEAEISAQTQLVNNLTSRIINEEYPNWDRFNKIQLKESISDLCDQEISFYQGLVDNWTDVEAKLVRRLEELT